MGENWQIEYDKRQYQLMAESLERFEEGRLDIASLISQLKALLNVLETPDMSWKDSFRSEWGALEMVYAVGLDRYEQGLIEDPQMTSNEPSNRAIIQNAIENMRRLLRERVGAPPGTSEK